MGQTRPQTDREKTQFNKRTQTQNLPHEPENKKPETPLPTIVTKLSATRNQPQCDIQLPGTKHRFFNLLKFVSKKKPFAPVLLHVLPASPASLSVPDLPLAIRVEITSQTMYPRCLKTVRPNSILIIEQIIYMYIYIYMYVCMYVYIYIYIYKRRT